jgi:hypothetical protein
MTWVALCAYPAVGLILLWARGVYTIVRCESVAELLLVNAIAAIFWPLFDWNGGYYPVIGRRVV